MVVSTNKATEMDMGKSTTSGAIIFFSTGTSVNRRSKETHAVYENTECVLLMFC